MLAPLLAALATLIASADFKVKVEETDDHVQIETDALSARINKKGYVSGVAAGSLMDKKTGARDLGFGLHIMDFLLAPGWKDDGYTRDRKLHGDLPKHYIEGPQICTQARKLTPEVFKGEGWAAVKLKFTFTEAAKGLKAGSVWEQVLVFRNGQRYFESSERITSVNAVKELFYRIDMPGHIKHKGGDSFSHVYLSHLKEPIPAKDFTKDFGPDEKFLYQRDDKKPLERMIRAYRVHVSGKPGPWLAGMTLDPAAACEGWCHQRGYVCMIQELHRRDVKAGESFGAAYLVGWFDDLPAMQAAYDKHKGASRIVLGKGGPRLE
jgi:hypothetical protein